MSISRFCNKLAQTINRKQYFFVQISIILTRFLLSSETYRISMSYKWYNANIFSLTFILSTVMIDVKEKYHRKRRACGLCRTYLDVIREKFDNQNMKKNRFIFKLSLWSWSLKSGVHVYKEKAAVCHIVVLLAIVPFSFICFIQ